MLFLHESWHTKFQWGYHYKERFYNTLQTVRDEGVSREINSAWEEVQHFSRFAT